MTGPPNKHNPYIGPRTFPRERAREREGEGEARYLFCGREREARDLSSLVVSTRLVLFYAPSGAGKSSLINAGLIPQLIKEGFVILPIGRVGGELPEGISDDDVDNVFVFNLLLSLDRRYLFSVELDPNELDRKEVSAELRKQFQESGEGLTLRAQVEVKRVGNSWTIVDDDKKYLIQNKDQSLNVYDRSKEDHRRFVNMPLTKFLKNLTTLDGEHFYYDNTPFDKDAEDEYEEPPHILIIDQFEEITTTHLHRWKDRKRFFRQLERAMVDDPLLWVVLSLREDYVAALEPYAPLLESRMRTRFYMQPMGHNAALEAIKEPARKGGHPFAPKVAEKLVDNLCQVRVQGQSNTQPGPSVEPVQLQVVCHQLWKEFTEQSLYKKPSKQITSRHLGTVIDFVDNALTSFYEQAIANVVETHKASEIALRAWFDRELIIEAKIRGMVYEGEESTAGLSNPVVKALRETFLLRPVFRSGRTWYELNHDRFVKPIAEANKIWWQKWQKQSPLIHDVRAWEDSGKDKSKLYPDQKLRDALDIVAQSDADPLIIEFFKASREKAESERRFKKDLSKTGWGVIFAQDAAPAIQEALGELLAHRRIQATKEHKHLYREYKEHYGYKSGESAEGFLARQSDPDHVPYYLLIVGDPESIPFTFQYQLSINYAVGRVHFESPVEYACYARSVVEAETNKVPLPHQATFFGVQQDYVTEHNSDYLVKPFKDLAKDQPEWNMQVLLKDETTKARLDRLLGGDETPALLFAVSRGIDFETDQEERRLLDQGALECQDSDLERWREEAIKERRRTGIPSKFYFAAGDVGVNARLLGLLAFFFADHSAGRPLSPGLATHTPLAIIPRAFVARLPRRLLGHPQGGALAVIGHVEEVAGFSPRDEKAIIGERLEIFFNTLNQLLEGYPVGAAMEYFNQRFSELLSELSDQLGREVLGETLNPKEKEKLKAAIVEARNYVIIGDPAARLMVGEQADVMPERPTIKPIKLRSEWVKPLTGHKDKVRSVAFSPNGQTILTASADKTIRLWTDAGMEIRHLKSRTESSWWSAAFSPDGQTIVAASSDRTVWLWDVTTGWDVETEEESLRLKGHTDQVLSAVFSPDGQTILTASLDRTARLWNVTTRKEIRRLEGHTDKVWSATFSPDGQTIATASSDRTARLWNAVTGEEIWRLEGHKDKVWSAAFSPDGQTIVTASMDKTARLWNAITGEEIRRLEGHIMPVQSAAFDPDGQTIVTASSDLSVRLWNAVTGEEIRRLEGHIGPVQSAAFSPDGQTIVTASSDKTARIWVAHIESHRPPAKPVA